MIVSMIVAMAANRVIGAANALPWYLPEDLKKFKDLTTGHAILMGRKTFDSLPRVLPGREHYVVTRNSAFLHTDDKAKGNEHVHSSPDPVSALEIIQDRMDTSGDLPDEVFVIGGGEIFTQLLPYTAKIYLTYVKKDIEGDTFFPQLDPCEWVETKRDEFDQFDFVEYERCDR